MKGQEEGGSAFLETKSSVEIGTLGLDHGLAKRKQNCKAGRHGRIEIAFA